jgi:deoxycytidylate deaminase
MRAAILLTIAVVIAIGYIAVPASASHKPNSWCSQSGDVCLSAKMSDGKRKLQIVLTSKFFGHYKLCVHAPDNSEACHTFRIRKRGMEYGSSINWATHYPNKGSGSYDVDWKQTDGSRVGRELEFHVR